MDDLDLESFISISLSNDLSNEYGNKLSLGSFYRKDEKYNLLQESVAGIQAQLNLLLSKMPNEPTLKMKSSTISSQLAQVSDELDSLKEQMLSLTNDNEIIEATHSTPKITPKTIDSSTPTRSVGSEPINSKKAITEQRIIEIVDQRIQIALQDFERTRLERILTDLSLGIQSKLSTEISQKQKTVKWNSLPKQKEHDQEAEVEMLLKKLKSKLHRREQLERQIEEQKNTKQTSASKNKIK